MGISTLSNPYICYLGNHLSVTLHSLIFFGPLLGRTRQAFSVARSGKISLEVCGE
jgi:hypothetical protein